MDKIQRTLIKAGHKDLAQEYYQKTSATPNKEQAQIIKEIEKHIDIMNSLSRSPEAFIRSLKRRQGEGKEKEFNKQIKKGISVYKNDIKFLTKKVEEFERKYSK